MSRIPTSVKSTRQILKGNNHILQSLLTQSRELLEIESLISRYVDEPFSISSLKNNELVLTTASGAIATRLRYRQRNLMSSLRRHGFDIKNIKIKVQPELQPPKPPEIERYLSPESAHQLAASAQYIEHEPLKKALISLSNRGGKSTGT